MSVGKLNSVVIAMDADGEGSHAAEGRLRAIIAHLTRARTD